MMRGGMACHYCHRLPPRDGALADCLTVPVDDSERRALRVG